MRTVSQVDQSTSPLLLSGNNHSKQLATITAIGFAALGIVSAVGVVLLFSSVPLLSILLGLTSAVSFGASATSIFQLFSKDSPKTPVTNPIPLSTPSSASTAPRAAPSRENLVTVINGTLQNLRSGSYTAPNGTVHSLSLNQVRTEKFGPTSRPSAPSTYRTILSVQEKDCLEAAGELAERGLNPLTLVLANATHVGGGYLTGARAQEEDCCRRSGLPFAIDVRHGHQTTNLYPLGPREGIYASNVPVFRGGRNNNYAHLNQPFTTAFGLIAAPDHPRLTNGRLNRQDESDIRAAVRNLLNQAFQKGHRSLVLGALGCGAFANPPEHVAEIFMDVIRSNFQGCFAEIVFAIIDDQNAHREHNPRGNFIPFAEAVERQGGTVVRRT